MTAPRPTNKYELEAYRLELEHKWRVEKLKRLDKVLTQPWPFIRVTLLLVIALGTLCFLVMYLVSHVHLPDLVQSGVEGLAWMAAIGIGMAIPTIKTWLQRALRKLTGKDGE